MISSLRAHSATLSSPLGVLFSRHPNASHASLMSFKSRYSIASAKQNHWEKDRPSIVGGKAGGVSRCFSLFTIFGVLESFLSLSHIGFSFLRKHSRNFGGMPLGTTFGIRKKEDDRRNFIPQLAQLLLRLL
jgi:hypothetical protein